MNIEKLQVSIEIMKNIQNEFDTELIELNKKRNIYIAKIAELEKEYNFRISENFQKNEKYITAFNEGKNVIEKSSVGNIITIDGKEKTVYTWYPVTKIEQFNEYNEYSIEGE